jgi:hypothetical protein
MATLDDGTNGYVIDSTDSNKGEYAKREYYGADAQFSLDWVIGVTTLRGEYLWGTQSGTGSSNISPTGRILPTPSGSNPSDTYIRPFSGGYVYFVQNILNSRHEIVVKYDFFDPNTDVKGTDIKSGNKFSGADVAYTTLGFGYNLRLYANLKLMAYYEIVKNEETALTTSTVNYTKDIKDNVFTLRLQFKF